jgi:hypothetical protein
MIQSEIFAALNGNAGVIAIAGHRIFPVRLPREAVLPAVSYSVPTTDSVNSLNGYSGADNNVIMITSWAKDYKTAHALSDAVRSSLSSLKAIIDDVSDDEDEETMNYGVIMSVRAWSTG